MRSLGEFVGHIAHAVRSDVTPPSTDNTTVRQSRQETQEQTVHTPDGRVVLRRTVIEEIELPVSASHTVNNPDVG